LAELIADTVPPSWPMHIRAAPGWGCKSGQQTGAWPTRRAG